VLALMQAVEDRGGAVAAIEQGFQKSEIERSAYDHARQVDAGERVVVGVNRFLTETEEAYQPLQVDPAIEREQAERLDRLRAERDGGAVERALGRVRTAGEGSENLMPHLREALRARATGGEVADALRDVWGQYQPRETF
jgi:methylmalonyl-CoA mutase, N-terminal domain